MRINERTETAITDDSEIEIAQRRFPVFFVVVCTASSRAGQVFIQAMTSSTSGRL
jgi:hypothetical protein